MLTKTFIAAALVVPALALSGAAFAQPYLGGPKAMFAGPGSTKTFETNKPYAQAVPAPRAGSKHVYNGGPKSNLPHSSLSDRF